MKRGWIKVSPVFWYQRKFRRIVKEVIKIEHFNFDPLSGAYIVVGKSPHFTRDCQEGERLPQYLIQIKTVKKKWFLFSWEKLEYSVINA